MAGRARRVVPGLGVPASDLSEVASQPGGCAAQRRAPGGPASDAAALDPSCRRGCLSCGGPATACEFPGSSCTSWTSPCGLGVGSCGGPASCLRTPGLPLHLLDSLLRPPRRLLRSSSELPGMPRIAPAPLGMPPADSRLPPAGSLRSSCAVLSIAYTFSTLAGMSRRRPAPPRPPPAPPRSPPAPFLSGSYMPPGDQRASDAFPRISSSPKP
jgi:hypothetical protein